MAKDVKLLYDKHNIPTIKKKASPEIEVLESKEPEASNTTIHTKNIMAFLVQAAASNKKSGINSTSCEPSSSSSSRSDGQSTSGFKYTVISTLKLLNELEAHLGGLGPGISSLLFEAVNYNICGKDPLSIFTDVAMLDLVDAALEKIMVATSRPGKGQDLVSSATVCIQSVYWLLKEIYDKLFCGINMLKLAMDTAGYSWDELATTIARRVLSSDKAGQASEETLHAILLSVTRLHQLRPDASHSAAGHGPSQQPAPPHLYTMNLQGPISMDPESVNGTRLSMSELVSTGLSQNLSSVARYELAATAPFPPPQPLYPGYGSSPPQPGHYRSEEGYPHHGGPQPHLYFNGPPH